MGVELAQMTRLVRSGFHLKSVKREIKLKSRQIVQLVATSMRYKKYTSTKFPVRGLGMIRWNMLGIWLPD